MSIKISILAITLLVLGSFLSGCSSTPAPQEKADLESIKTDRTGLDYQGEKDKDTLFRELDEKLQQWHAVQSVRDHANTNSLEGSLRQMASGHFSQLVDAIEKGRDFEKTVAVAAIGFSEEQRAIPYLLKVLELPNPVLRKYAGFSLGHIGSDQTPMPPLCKYLAEEPDDKARGMIAFAISRIVSKDKDEGALADLLKATQDKAPEVRSRVVIALGRIGKAEALPAIITHSIPDPEPVVRYNALWALKQIGGRDILVPMIRKMRDPIPIVRIFAYKLLKLETGKDLGEDPKKWEEWAGM